MITPNALVGSWRLRKHTQFFGAPLGMLLYHPDRSMAVVIQGKVLKDGALIDQVIAYAGVYTVKGNEVLHHVEVSDNPIRVGTILARHANLVGSTLTLTETPDPKVGFAVVWEKDASVRK